jgi:hypothetical protein
MTQQIKQESHEILDQWLASCTRHGKISRNTVAIGIVVLDHLKRSCPASRAKVISQGGEVSGARSGLGKILAAYDLPESYLKEITTRQGHQDGQRLFEQFEWGKKLAKVPDEERLQLLDELIERLRNLATAWLKRQNLKLDLDRQDDPDKWISVIIENATGRSGGIVEQQLVGAKLEKRYQDFDISNYPAHAADKQTDRAGDFAVSRAVYHVTAAPSRNVIQKCKKNLKAGLLPILLVPREHETTARVLAKDEKAKGLMIIALESFVGTNIVELATVENKSYFEVLQEIVQIYNRRLAEAETDLSLQIEIH